MFFQHRVGKKVFPQRATRLDGLWMSRTTSNTPSTGQYYCNGAGGMFIFSAVDWAFGVTLDYIVDSPREYCSDRVGSMLRGYR